MIRLVQGAGAAELGGGQATGVCFSIPCGHGHETTRPFEP